MGKDYYGLIIFAQAVISYLVILQNFGLNTFAVKEISIHANDKEKISSIVSNVLVLKGFLFIASLLILYIIILFISSFKSYEVLLFLTMWVCLFDFIFPKWYFQGLEKMKYITYIHFFSKIIVLILIFTLINKPEDYLRLPFFYLIGALLSGILSLIIIFKYHKIKFTSVTKNELKKIINKSTTFFISEVSVSIFANSNKVIIGSVLGMVELAYYDLADKVISAFKNVPLHIVRNTIYPQVAKTKNIKIIHNVSIIMGTYSIIVILFILIFAPFIVTLLGGSDMMNSVNILKIFSISILTTHISNYYITVGLWSLGYEKLFRNLMIYATIVFLICYAILWFLNIINIYTITLVPIFVDLYLIIHTYYIYKKKNLF